VELTESQRQAIETQCHHTVVTAGAGSGKTAVLARRIAHLISHGASASEILAITFTRMAATELRERVRGCLRSGAERLSMAGITIGTYHAAAFRILQRERHHLGYREPLTVATPADAEELLKHVAKQLGYLGKAPAGHDAPITLERIRQYLEGEYTGKPPAWLNITNAREYGAVIGEYWERLWHWCVVDYGLILLKCNQLLRGYPEVLETWRRKYRHVLVDEIQDTDAVQYKLHEWFTTGGGTASLFAVGDLRQEVYGWRGADGARVNQRFPDAERIYLPQCFRCGDRIVDAANALIKHNPEGQQAMIGATGSDGQVEVIAGRSAGIVGKLSILNADHLYAWSDIAVLARTHRELRQLKTLCDEAEVPAHHVGGALGVCDTMEFRLVHAALRLCVNPRDNLAFLLLREAFGLSPADYNQLCLAATQKRCSPFQAHIKAATDSDLLAAILEATPDTSLLPPESVWAALDASAEIAAAIWPHEHCNCRLGETCTDNPGAPLCAFWSSHCPDMSIPEALEWFASHKQPGSSQDDLTPEGANEVTLATVHAAKGLEWPSVVVVGLNEGTVPSSQSLKEPGGLEAERRLFYVAMTRAKELAVLHYRRAQDQSSKGKMSPPSRFLSEAGVMGL
jgi:superfamily I DNA/RNA helicase